MTDEEECLLLRALIDGTAEVADEQLREHRGAGVTQSELRALEERGVLELVHMPEGDGDEERLGILGLTPAGLEYAEGCEVAPARDG